MRACSARRRSATSVKNAENCFEITGFDVLIDASLKPWLVEVNAAPSFSWDTRADRALKRKVVGDALDVLDLESVVLEQYGDAYAESRSRNAANRPAGSTSCRTTGRSRTDQIGAPRGGLARRRRRARRRAADAGLKD